MSARKHRPRGTGTVTAVAAPVPAGTTTATGSRSKANTGRRGEQDYHDIARELPDLELDDLDPDALRRAEKWARSHDMLWPPLPEQDGWQVRGYQI